MIAEPSMPSYLMTFCSLARPENRMSCQVPSPAFCEPGACSISCDIWRPLTGRPCTSRSLTLAPMRAELMSSTGAVRHDRHALLHAGRPELEVERQFLADGQRHLRVFDGGEARLLGGDRVGRWLQRADHEEALVVAQRRADLAGLLVLHLDRRAGDERAARIAHRAADATVSLGRCERGQQGKSAPRPPPIETSSLIPPLRSTRHRGQSSAD